MFGQLARLGVKRAMILTIGAALALVGSAAGFSIDQVVVAALEESLVQRGQAEVRLLATEVAQPLALNHADALATELETRFDEDTEAYVVVVLADGTVAAKRFARTFTGTVEEVLKAHAPPYRPPSFRSGEVTRFSAPIVVVVPRLARPSEDRVLGQVFLGITSTKVGERINAVRLAVLGLLCAGGLALVALVYYFTTRLVLAPVDRMSAVARRMGDSDLTARAEETGTDELGLLAASLNRTGENLAKTISRVQSVTEGVAEVIGRIGLTGAGVSAGAATVSARAGDTSASMGAMIASLKGIGENVEVLAGSAESSSSSILQMAATNDEVAENIRALAASVEETTAAIEEMTYSIKEVATNIEDLSSAAEQTSSAVNEMDVSISQVETNANETARLSEQAQRDAEMGAEALVRTLGGIDKIKESSKEAAQVIEALGKKIGAIGNILDVIDDVAEQTNLLALNAAILAAQSGEHGKGFAVVADEIKDLAERTGSSTKEIGGLIRAVQEQSKAAVAAMDRGVRNVEEGVRLGQETETALKKIEQSSHQSTQMVRAIARATIEQARGSKQVTASINRIAETVQQIATATSEQARGSEQIMKSAEKMRSITKHVERSSQEQARGSKQVTQAIESISEMVHHLNRAQKDQARGSDQVMGAVMEIKQVAEAQTDAVRDLEQAIADLAGQADVLRGEVRRFKL
jgi:methyl-accepting chemotaxis protein